MATTNTTTSTVIPAGDDTTTIVALLQRAMDAYTTVKGAYFWTPAGAASSRRNEEDRLSHHLALAFTVHEPWKTKVRETAFVVEMDLDVKCSCRNVYVSKATKINGRETNATAIAGLMRRLGKPGTTATLA